MEGFVLLLGVIFLVVGFKVWSEKRGRDKALRAIRDEIERNATALHINRMQLVLPDHYGTVLFDRWDREKAYFVETRVIPIVRSTRPGQIDAELASTIDGMIETAALRPIPPAGEENRDVFISNPEEFDPRMDPLDYERYCAFVLERAGWRTRLTAVTGDQGADIIASRSGKTLVVQCKLYCSTVGNDAVQQAHAARAFQSADVAAVVSNQPFTRSARELAKVSGVRLFHHDELSGFSA